MCASKSCFPFLLLARYVRSTSLISFQVCSQCSHEHRGFRLTRKWTFGWSDASCTPWCSTGQRVLVISFLQRPRCCLRDCMEHYGIHMDSYGLIHASRLPYMMIKKRFYLPTGSWYVESQHFDALCPSKQLEELRMFASWGPVMCCISFGVCLALTCYRCESPGIPSRMSPPWPSPTPDMCGRSSASWWGYETTKQEGHIITMYKFASIQVNTLYYIVLTYVIYGGRSIWTTHPWSYHK